MKNSKSKFRSGQLNPASLRAASARKQVSENKEAELRQVRSVTGRSEALLSLLFLYRAQQLLLHDAITPSKETRLVELPPDINKAFWTLDSAQRYIFGAAPPTQEGQP